MHVLRVEMAGRPWLVLVALAFRMAILLQAFWLVDVDSGTSLWLLVVLAMAPNFAETAWVLRRPAGTRYLPVADTGYAVLVTTGALLLAPDGRFADVVSLTLPLVIGTVLMWTLVRGGLAVATRAERRGREAERERHRRDVHDTVLPVMESLALPAPGDTADPAASLNLLRRTARAQAMRLRLSLDGESAPQGGLVNRFQDLAVALAEEGLHVDVVTLASPEADFPDAAADALHDAGREALRNTLKHAGTTRAVVCVDATTIGVGVTIRDHGKGFRAGGHRGFGIEHSIVRRLTEIGGRAAVESAPGRGTRVELWAPARVRQPVG